MEERFALPKLPSVSDIAVGVIRGGKKAAEKAGEVKEAAENWVTSKIIAIILLAVAGLLLWRALNGVK